jgi:hypothetical protein
LFSSLVTSNDARCSRLPWHVRPGVLIPLQIQFNADQRRFPKEPDQALGRWKPTHEFIAAPSTFQFSVRGSCLPLRSLWHFRHDVSPLSSPGLSRPSGGRRSVRSSSGACPNRAG